MVVVPLACLGLGLSASVYFQPRSTPLSARVAYFARLCVAINFMMFWLVPLVVLGAVHKKLLLKYLLPLYERMDSSPWLRTYAEKHIYARPKHADYFATQLIFMANLVCVLAYMNQMANFKFTYGYMPWWMIAVYNCLWAGLGGRNLGTAYFMAHKEAHNMMLYQPWIRNTLGNVFENWVGVIYGGVPNNFTTAHIALHHRFDAGRGDTLYCWDLNRSAWPDFLVYLARGLLHMTGFSALYQFHTSPRKESSSREIKRLTRGVLVYWVLVPCVMLRWGPAPSFWFWAILQPLLCMTFFLALINLGFHAFIESDSAGQRIQCVESITLIGSEDNYFGEDDHMAHHYYPLVYWRDTEKHQDAQRDMWARYHASVFQGADIFSFSFMVVLKAWPILADRFVDYSGKLTKEQISQLLEARATRREMEYYTFLPPVPAVKPSGYGKELPNYPPEGSESYLAVLKMLASLQLSAAGLLDKGLPPVQNRKSC